LRYGTCDVQAAFYGSVLARVLLCAGLYVSVRVRPAPPQRIKRDIIGQSTTTGLGSTASTRHRASVHRRAASAHRWPWTPLFRIGSVWPRSRGKGFHLGLLSYPFSQIPLIGKGSAPAHRSG
jgi:hypothetical protein